MSSVTVTVASGFVVWLDAGTSIALAT